MYRAKKAVKDEKKDQTAPLVLNNIADSSSESETEPDGECTVCILIRSSVCVYT